MQNTQERYVMACPLNGKACCEGNREDFSKRADGVAIKCRWWTHLYGKDPQTDATIDQWDCAVAWLPTTTIETSQMSRQAAASTDKLTNIIAGAVRPRPPLNGNPEPRPNLEHGGRP